MFGFQKVPEHSIIIQPISRRQILDSSKLKDFADDNLKFDENGRQLSKRVENTVGKGEIARYEQILLFSQCFQKACFSVASKGVIVWEWVNLRQNKTVVLDISNVRVCLMNNKVKNKQIHRIMQTKYDNWI